MKTSKQVAHEIRQKHGIEMTPAEVHKERRCAYASIRAGLRAKGYDPPDTDEALIEWMASMAGGHDKLARLMEPAP